MTLFVREWTTLKYCVHVYSESTFNGLMEVFVIANTVCMVLLTFTDPNEIAPGKRCITEFGQSPETGIRTIERGELLRSISVSTKVPVESGINNSVICAES